jgi:hypothetical protein
MDVVSGTNTVDVPASLFAVTDTPVCCCIQGKAVGCPYPASQSCGKYSDGQQKRHYDRTRLFRTCQPAPGPRGSQAGESGRQFRRVRLWAELAGRDGSESGIAFRSASKAIGIVAVAVNTKAVKYRPFSMYFSVVLRDGFVAVRQQWDGQGGERSPRRCGASVRWPAVTFQRLAGARFQPVGRRASAFRFSRPLTGRPAGQRLSAR